MHLKELKQRTPAELVSMAEDYDVEGASTMRRQDLMFAILKEVAEDGEEILGIGTIEVLQDGFGFLRSADCSYLAGPDDIYVSPSQIRRFNLRTGDTITGKIRPPKDQERYFALLKVNEINFDVPDSSRHKVLLENLTPLFPDEKFNITGIPCMIMFKDGKEVGRLVGGVPKEKIEEFIAKNK